MYNVLSVITSTPTPPSRKSELEMDHSEVRHQLDRILDSGEVLDLELIIQRPLEKYHGEGDWVEARPASDCFTVVLIGHVRTKG